MKGSDLEFLSSSSRAVLQVTVDNDYLQTARAMCDEYRGREIEITVKPWRNKRTLDANAYAWVLIGKLAAALRITPTEVYRTYIPDVGGNYKIVPVKTAEVGEWKRLWCDGHIGRQVDDMGACRLITDYRNLRCYIGSSDYDGAQMSRLIDMIITDCRDNGIETKTPAEIAEMVGAWDDQ